MEAEIASRMRFFFPDVQARGYYPGYATKCLNVKASTLVGKKRRCDST